MKYALLDPLRGLAALWVFLFHYHYCDTLRQECPSLCTLFATGHLGVPMFFVISGYCLTASARNAISKNESAGSFLYRRAMRIYPAFWLSIIVVVSLPYLIEVISSLKTGTYIPPSSENLNYGFMSFGDWDWLRYATLTQVFYPDGSGLSAKFTRLNAVYWTLAIEFQFYLVVMLALVTRKRFYLTLLATTALSLPFLLYPATRNIGIFFPYWPMFAVGIGLFWALEKGIEPERLFDSKATVVAVGTVGVGSLAFVAFVVSGGHPNYLCFATFLAVMLWFAKPLDGRFAALSTAKHVAIRIPLALFLVLGAMSYSVYLLHGRLNFLVAQFSRQIFPVNSIINDVVVILGTCALCYPFYRCCEVPFIRARVGKRNGRPDSPPSRNSSHDWRADQAG